MVKLFSLIVMLVTLLLWGSLAAPQANAFGGARARAQARGDARVARALGGNVVLPQRVVLRGCHGVGVSSFGQTIILR